MDFSFTKTFNKKNAITFSIVFMWCAMGFLHFWGQSQASKISRLPGRHENKIHELFLEAQKDFAQNNFDSSLKKVNQILALDENHVYAQILKSRIMTVKIGPLQAIEWLSTQMNLNPTKHLQNLYHESISENYLRSNQIDKAIDSLKNSLMNSPHPSIIHERIATLCLQSHKNHEAIHHFKESLEHRQSFLNLYKDSIQKSLIFEYSDAQYSTALENLTSKANLKFIDSNYDRDSFDQELATSRRHALIHNSLGTAYASIKNFTLAKFHWNQSLKIDKNNVDAQKNLDQLRKLNL